MNWNTKIPEGLGEREDAPRTMRFPKALGAELDALAKEHGTTFTEYTMRLLQLAVAEVKAQRNVPAKKLKRAG